MKRSPAQHAAATAVVAAKRAAKRAARPRPKAKAPRTKDGKRACDRCLKAEGTREIHSEGKIIFFCEGCRETRWREQTFKHNDLPHREVMVMDRLRTDASRLVETFILHQLRAYDMSGGTAYIKLETHAALRKQAVRVTHFTPPRKRGRGSTKWRPWLEAAVGLRPRVTWPVREEIKIGTAQIDDELAVELMRKDWYFEMEDVEWADAAEALAYGAGVGLHKVLRKLGQIKGRDVGTEARRFGILWLAEFRAWRPANEEKRGVQALLASG